MAGNTSELENLTDEELELRVAQDTAEQARRETIRMSGSYMDAILTRYREATGTLPGYADEWINPEGSPWGCYPLGMVVTHKGQKYQSMIHANHLPPTDGDAWQAIPEDAAAL